MKRGCHCLFDINDRGIVSFIVAWMITSSLMHPSLLTYIICLQIMSLAQIGHMLYASHVSYDYRGNKTHWSNLKKLTVGQRYGKPEYRHLPGINLWLQISFRIIHTVYKSGQIPKLNVILVMSCSCLCPTH